MVGKLIENSAYGYGYNAQTGEYGDLVKLGIIDPTKVVRTAMQDAASVAGLLITTEAIISEQPKKELLPAACRRRRRHGRHGRHGFLIEIRSQLTILHESPGAIRGFFARLASRLGA